MDPVPLLGISQALQKSSCVVSTETLRVENAFQQHDLSQCLSDDDTNMQLVVSILRESVSILGVSLDLDLYLKSPVSTMELLQSRRLRLSSLPPGETLNQLLLLSPHTHSSRPYPYCKSYSPYMHCVPLLGWIERTSQTCITFAKLEGERDELAITCSLSVTDDFSWHVVAGGNKLSSTSERLSAMPQPVSCVRDVLHVIEFLDSLVPCCGNNDKKFFPLSMSRNGSFPSASGKNFVFFFVFPLVHVYTCTCGCAVLLCLVCLFDLACFFLSSLI